jgi:HD domain
MSIAVLVAWIAAGFLLLRGPQYVLGARIYLTSAVREPDVAPIRPGRPTSWNVRSIARPCSRPFLATSVPWAATGVAVAFGRHLGFSSEDKQRLAFAGLLHDIGKAGVPVAILEKPSPLGGEEVAAMRQHPLLGFEVLRRMRGLDPEMLNMVVHHHEYLDGSGYPHGLEGRELSDLVRMMTIADVFGALIERRAYKAPLSFDAAYQILENMGPRLDADLVREFRPFARARIK